MLAFSNPLILTNISNLSIPQQYSAALCNPVILCSISVILSKVIIPVFKKK